MMRRLWRRALTLPSNGGRRHERGQVLPISIMFMSIFILFAWFLLDVAGVQNVSGNAIAGGLRAGGLAALQERGPIDSFGRWYVCIEGQGAYAIDPGCAGLDGDVIAREYVAQNLLGDPSLGSGGYDDMFGSRASALALLSSGTDGGANDGLDVEILNPAAQDGQTSDAFLNGVSIGATPCAGSGSFPASIESTILGGECFDTATIILRVKIPNRHVLGTFGSITNVVVVRAGTDAS